MLAHLQQQQRVVHVAQGMLAIGAALLGSPCVLGADIDADALDVAQRNCDAFEEPLPVSELRHTDAASLRCSLWPNE